MPYNPGVQDMSGQIRAQGMMQSSGNMANSFGKIIQDYTQKQEQNKQAMAAVKGTAQFLKTNAQLLGIDENTLQQMTTQQPNESPLQWHARMGSYVSGVMQKPVIQQAQAKIAEANAQTGLYKTQAEQMAAELAGRNRTEQALANPDVAQFLDDPEMLYKTAIAKGARPQDLANNPFVGAALQRRSKEQINEARMANASEIVQLRADLANARAGVAKIPEGFRQKQDGSLEPIPGGPEYLKQQKEKTAADAQASSGKEDVAASLYNVNKALNLVAQGAGGSMDSLVASIPGVKGLAPKTTELKSLYNSIQSALKLEKLAQLKSLSATGSSGLGQLSDAEGRSLATAIAELDPSLPENVQKERLATIRSHLMKLGMPKSRFTIVEGN